MSRVVPSHSHFEVDWSAIFELYWLVRNATRQKAGFKRLYVYDFDDFARQLEPR